MKTFLKLSALAAVAATALVSCQQETFVPEEQGEVHITVKAVPQDFANETRTYIDGTNTIIWGTGEYMTIGVLAGETTVFATSSADYADVWNGESEAYFGFSLTPGATADSYTYVGMYPASAAIDYNAETPYSSNTHADAFKVYLPSTQNATASSYDPSAYIMVARPESFTSIQTEWTASYRRATALNKITLTNIPEDIVSVEFTAPDEVYMAGRRYIDLTTGDSGELYGDTRTETIEVRAALTGESKIVWFTSWDTEIPVGSTFKIVAKSATKSYTRTLTVANKSITFKEGYLNTLKVNMASAAVEDLENYAGNYLIGARPENDWILMTSNHNSNNNYFISQSTNVTVAPENVSFSDFSNVDDYIWEVSKVDGGYAIKSLKTGKYLNLTENGNKAHVSDSPVAFSLDIAADHEATVKSNTYTDRVLMYNATSPRFAFYTGTQKDIYMIPAVVDERETLTLAFDQSAINLTAAEAVNFGGQDVKAYLGEDEITGLTFTYSWDGSSDFGGLIENTSTVFLSGEAGTATVTASFAGDDDYKPATASYTITVTVPVSLEGWVETDLADIAAGDVFVMVANDTYAIPHDGSSAPVLVSVTVSDSKLTGTVASNIQWNLTGNATDGYTFYPNGNNAKYLYCSTTATSSSNDNLRIGTGNRKLFVLDNGGHIMTHDSYTDRYIGINGTSNFRGYTSATPQNVTEAIFKFYKFYDDGKVTAEVSFTPASDEVVWNATLAQPTLSKPEGLVVSFESSNSAIATVDASSGVITVVKPGSVTITASWNEQTVGSTTYREGSAVFALTVKKASASVAFNNPVLTVAVNGTQTNVATPTPSSLTVNYSSSNTDVATVDADGKVSGVANGVAVITASVGNEYYEDATDEYTITVGSGGPQAQWEVVTDFTSIVSGDKYMFVNVQNGNSYYMSTQTCTVGNGTKCVKLTSLPTTQGFVTDDNMILILTGNATDGYIASNLEGKELFIKNTNNGLGFVNEGTSVKFYTDNTVSGYTLSGYDNAGTPVLRYIGMNSTTNFRCYTSVNSNVKTGEYVWYHYIGN